MHIVIRSGPQEKIRADQCGDWWVFGDNQFAIHVLETMSPEAQFAVAIHELVEAYLCRKEGIDEELVSAFDEHYEKERKDGKHGPNDEPGDDPRAPYRTQHLSATFVERAVCSAIGIPWAEHNQIVACSH